MEFNEDKDKSHSEFGQYVHDKLPRTFYWTDVDGISYRVYTRILRIIENKLPHQELKKSQKQILPLLAKAIDYLIEQNFIDKESGVFIIKGISPYEKVSIEQIGHLLKIKVDNETLNKFLSGERTI